MFVDHGFTEINLKTIIANIAPAIHFNHMKPTVIFPRPDPSRELPSAWHVNSPRCFHAQRFVRAGIIVLFFPALQRIIRVSSVIEHMEFEEFIFH